MNNICSEITTFFADLNINVEEPVLLKCQEICEKYELEPEMFVDQWFAFSTNNMKGANPTVASLLKMERKELIKNKGTPKPDPIKNASENPVRNFTSSAALSSPTKVVPRPMEIVQPPTPIVNEELLSVKPYSQRENAGKIVCQYGTATDNFMRLHHHEITLNSHDGGDFKYMYEIPLTLTTYISDATYHLAEQILFKFNLQESPGDVRSSSSQDVIVTYGRILSDCEDKLNAVSCMLECDSGKNNGYCASLKLDFIENCSLFPGQIVVVEGSHESIRSDFVLTVHRLLSEIDLELPKVPAVLEESMQIMVASGPFTMHFNLNYEPLLDLIQKVKESKPHILILFGPFLDCTNTDMIEIIDQDYDALRFQWIERIMLELDGLDIQVVIVSSQDECGHHPVYPTPPYKLPNPYDDRRLRFVSDPFMIDVNGLLIGGTGIDTLRDLAKFEFTLNHMPNRMERLVGHLFDQKSFYPLHPPSSTVNLDQYLMNKYGTINVKPHLMILPSILNSFAKPVKGAFVVNPGRLAKKFVGGHYARIEVGPGTSKSICDRVACEIVQI